MDGVEVPACLLRLPQGLGPARPFPSVVKRLRTWPPRALCHLQEASTLLGRDSCPGAKAAPGHRARFALRLFTVVAAWQEGGDCRDADTMRLSCCKWVQISSGQAGKGHLCLGKPRGLGTLLTLQESINRMPHLPGLEERGEAGGPGFVLKTSLALGGSVLDSKS